MPTSLAARVLSAPPSVGPVRLVCIDGPAGSGKSTLAERLRTELGRSVGEVPVVRGDDVYEGWAVVAEAPERVAAFALLAVRLTGWLLDPWAAGSPATHPVWDWRADAWGRPVTVDAAPVVILEGVGLASRALRSRAVLSVWVDADPLESPALLERVVARDGEDVRAAMGSWQVDERAWHRLDGTRAGCDVVA